MATPTQNPYLVFDQRYDLEPSEDNIRPIFLFASIWRSGSTLLQRTLCTDSSLIMWGEPYAQLGLITSFAENAKCLYKTQWPAPKNWLFDVEEWYENLSEHFIANLYPKPRFLRESYRAQLDHLFVPVPNHVVFRASESNLSAATSQNCTFLSGFTLMLDLLCWSVILGMPGNF